MAGPDDDPDHCSSRKNQPVLYCVTPPPGLHCQEIMSESAPLYLGYRYECDPAPRKARQPQEVAGTLIDCRRLSSETIMPDVILKHVPGMKRASAVPVLRAEDLSEEVFIRDYVSNSQPCVIRGAVKHWPAVQNWRDKTHLKKRSGHHNVSLFSTEYHARWDRLEAGKREVSFADAIDHLQAEETKIGILVEPLTELQTDLGGLPFLTKAQPAFTYAAARYFFYRNAGTSWHFHSFDTKP